MESFERREIAPDQNAGANSDRKSLATFAEFALDHAAFERKRSNADDVIDSKSLERASREKPVSTFSHRALSRATSAGKRDVSRGEA
jgi:hypothetical protein